jgi:DNA-binding MarR family transcriptional regulator
MGSQTISRPPSPDQRRVFDALRWIIRELRLAQASGGQAGLSAAQRFVLHLLQGREGLSVGELAELTATDPSSVSVVIRKLHERHLVTKKPCARDRRKLLVTLTAAGAKAIAGEPVPVQQVLMGRLAGLRPRELHALAGLLERLAPPVEAGRPAPMFFQDGADARREP